jgi:tRNA (guanine-N7-)-methyltransferase
VPLAVGIPSKYIPDQDLRLRLYRRIADLRDEREIDALVLEFLDRFGPPPEMLQNLLYQMRIKLLAEKISDKGELNIATDWQPYAKHIQETVKLSSLFEQVPSSTFIQQRPQTKFERRGEKLGHEVSDQVYLKKTS